MPVRLRVAAAFAVAMAIVLAGAGTLIYVRLGDDLARALDQELRLRAQDVQALLSDPSRSLAAEAPGNLIEPGESFAQLLDSHGDVLDSTRAIGSRPLVALAELERSPHRARFVNVPSVPGLDEPARLLVTPLQRAGQRLALVVGATRENRAEALRSLRTELLVAGPIALLVATALGYLLAGAGLRAVEEMRTRAARISAHRPGARLPVPPTGDELQRLGETLNAMLERLEAAFERERGFVAEAGHELRTPLALLRAELDFALHHAESEEELRDAVRNASEETDRLVQLAGDLLLIASAQDGQIPLQLEPIDARELLDSVRTRFSWRAEANGRRLVVDVPEPLTLSGDRLRLEQALGNLVDNALRYGAGAVRLSARPSDGLIELSVHDEGEGFALDFIDRAFLRFSRADGARSSPGAGLGLAIVSTIAAAHRGRVAASNAQGGGATVSIGVPAANAIPDSDPGQRPFGAVPNT